METINEVYEFYNNGAEVDRLERGLGIIEFYRSLDNHNATIYFLPSGTLCLEGFVFVRYIFKFCEKKTLTKFLNRDIIENAIEQSF